VWFFPPFTPLGVGNNPEPVPPVWGTDGTSRNNERPDSVAVTFQLCGNGVETEANMSANILGQDPTGASFSNDSVHLRPEVSRVRFPKLLARCGEGLAGVSTANNVNCSGELAAVERADVVVDRYVGPVPGEDLSAVGVDLAERGGAHPGSFEPKAESADPAEEIEDVVTEVSDCGSL